MLTAPTMSRSSVIPPLSHSKHQHQTKHRSEVLRRRLASAESDTQRILEDIGYFKHDPLAGGDFQTPSQTSVKQVHFAPNAEFAPDPDVIPSDSNSESEIRTCDSQGDLPNVFALSKKGFTSQFLPESASFLEIAAVASVNQQSFPLEDDEVVPSRNPKCLAFDDSATSKRFSPQTSPLEEGATATNLPQSRSPSLESASPTKPPQNTSPLEEGAAGFSLPTTPSPSQDVYSLIASSDKPADSDDGLVDANSTSYSPKGIVSRVCRLESMLQTLKVGVAGSVTAVNQKRTRAELDDAVEQIKQELGSEVSRLRRQVAALQEELNMEMNSQQRLKVETDKLKEALEESVQARAEAAAALEELSLTKQKLVERVGDMKEELTRECEMRASLEQSHSTLLCRVQETEAIVDQERQEVQAVSNNASSLQQEVMRLQEELAAKQSRLQEVEETNQQLMMEKEDTESLVQAAESDCQLASGELNRLQSQYETLIQQFQQTQQVLDQQRTHIQELETDRDGLKQLAEQASSDQQRANTLQKHLTEVEDNHRLVKKELEEEVSQLLRTVTDLTAQSTTLQNKVTQLEEEAGSCQTRLADRESYFASAAGGLESELQKMQGLLQDAQKEKEEAVKSQENLLEEVNQTVDNLVDERSELKNELEKALEQAETESARCRQLESENAQLLNRIANFEEQLRSQQGVEHSLQEMMQQKNRLAYQNGLMTQQLSQLTQDLAASQAQSMDREQLRRAGKAAQTKAFQLHGECEELRVRLHRLQGELQQSREQLQHKQQELQLVQRRGEELQRDKEQLQERVQVLDTKDKNKTQRHHKNMEDAKSVNREIANTLESVMQSHGQLQELVENLQAELGRRDAEIARLNNLRTQDQDKSQEEVQRLQVAMETMCVQLKQEHERSSRKISKEVVELRKQNSQLTARNTDLVTTNTQLRQRTGEMEWSIGELQQKVSTQKQRVSHMHKVKKSADGKLKCFKNIQSDIDELEKMRDQYLQKNKEQGENIASFMKQMTMLQEEVRQLASAHLTTGRLLQRKQLALDKETRLREELRHKYTDTAKLSAQSTRQKEDTDKRLQAVHDESVEISKSLQDAHEWFKGKFDRLQEELRESKRAQQKLEKANALQRQQLMTEKTQAQEAADRAKELIKTSVVKSTKIKTKRNRLLSKKKPPEDTESQGTNSAETDNGSWT